ncbi:MAG: hypothetical protein AAF787_18225 [Chloroflexota bacterium]
MYPEDRVLVGVCKTKRDLTFARDAHWYRIPQGQMPRGVYTEYIALFVSGSVFKEQSGTVAYYARWQGVELARRRELIPSQPDHKRADEVYYKIKLGELKTKTPPITNPTKRVITFVHTTWDRFISARTIADLYSDADRFVDRIYHALRSPQLRVERWWEADYKQTGYAPQLRIICQKGDVVASTEPGMGNVYLDASKGDDELLAQIRDEIARHDGPYMIDLPPDFL